MSLYPAPLARLIEELSRLPSIGEKTAARLAFHMLKGNKDDVLRLADSIGKLRQQMGLCQRCFGFSEVNLENQDGALCAVCRNPEREKDKICVVEEPADLLAVEKSQEFRGLYHVLLGALSPLDGVGPGDIKADELVERVKLGGVDEIILATNPTIEGEATAIYLTRLLKPFGVRVSRIAYGIPVGMDIEYADEVTLLKSIEGRRDL